MDSTTNINLEKPAQSDTFAQFLEAINLNSDKLDALPLPVGYGSNSQMEYLKLACGVIAMWGHFDHGSNYKCTTTLIPGTSYCSKSFKVNYPIPLVDSNPVVLTSCVDSAAIECKASPRAASYSSVDIIYYCPTEEPSNSTRTKSCDILIIGKWK
ncbi:hypothetical protein [Gordonibacter massiliensis (ex Traore et al. 2017)]|uniref:hypothetical protein n=1 Tax=Gordonibacter massiliensis (ex Traore et al. 2017) TaxID=1841863 RepID=UPI001C8BC722|nr:hypothetical protein [Gordonibacter massiliensis (ex Traore et al. 2017)]MBX9032676.1 hypothetical protein [Gordonibacter massiliensis (ex Traore et al. 2017)]